MLVQICGPGCANCEKAAKIVQEALDRTGIRAEVAKITEFAEMARLGVLSTPAVIIDGKIRCTGRVPTGTEVEGWLKN